MEIFYIHSAGTFWQLLRVMTSPCARLVIKAYIDGLVEDCSISSALAMDILQSCTMSSILFVKFSNTITSYYGRILVNQLIDNIDFVIGALPGSLTILVQAFFSW